MRALTHARAHTHTHTHAHTHAHYFNLQDPFAQIREKHGALNSVTFGVEHVHLHVNEGVQAQRTFEASLPVGVDFILRRAIVRARLARTNHVQFACMLCEADLLFQTRAR
jgi:hypothetical protein